MIMKRMIMKVVAVSQAMEITAEVLAGVVRRMTCILAGALEVSATSQINSPAVHKPEEWAVVDVLHKDRMKAILIMAGQVNPDVVVNQVMVIPDVAVKVDTAAQ